MRDFSRSPAFLSINQATTKTWTLAEAIAMYERAGYRRVDRYNDNPYAELFFEKALS